MSAPMDAATFLQVLKGAGLPVMEVGSWRTHNRNDKGPWGPVHGVMIHHTVTKGTEATVRICRNGYEDLPGPLCHGVIAKSGTVYLVGYGRANHAGLGDRDVLNAVRSESYATRPPVPNGELVDFNPHFYGFECENLGDGRDPWPPAQQLAIAAVSSAICRHHGWSEKSVIGHLEAQPGKVDPRSPGGMPAIRTAVATLLRPPAPRPPAPRPPLTVEQRLDANERRLRDLERDVEALKKG